MVRYQLLRPVAYLSIKHPTKPIFDWWIPGVFSVLIVAALYFNWGELNIYGAEGLLSKLTSFVQTLPGFFIAALSVIATFNRLDIDKLLPEPTPKVDVIVRGQVSEIELTRRRFLCMLFAYLTLESFFLAISPIFVGLYVPILSKALLPMAKEALSFIFILLYIFAFIQMLVITMLGLYYLGDRLHQPDV